MVCPTSFMPWARQGEIYTGCDAPESRGRADELLGVLPSAKEVRSKVTSPKPYSPGSLVDSMPKSREGYSMTNRSSSRVAM